MRCGICGKDTMRHPRSGDQVRMHDHDALNRHKILEHPIEYRAAREARQAKADAIRQAKAAETRRVSDARLAASKPVVIRYHGEGEPETYPSSQVIRYQVSSWNNQPQKTDVRFPDADAYRLYEEIMAEIGKLEIEAREELTAAWDMGTPVTLEHLDELDHAAIARASPQAR